MRRILKTCKRIWYKIKLWEALEWRNTLIKNGTMASLIAIDAEITELEAKIATLQ